MIMKFLSERLKNIGYEVKTEKRTINFKPKFIIDKNTFENTGKFNEDFTKMTFDFKEFLQRQEKEIKEAFHLGKMEQIF